MTSQEQHDRSEPVETFPCTIEGCTHKPFATPAARTNHMNNVAHPPPGEDTGGAATWEPPTQEPAEEPPEGVYTAREPAGPCRMCSATIDEGQQYMVINIGRRVHYGDCSDQARAAGYLGQIEADAGPA